MIFRNLSEALLKSAAKDPIVALMGPKKTGKSTLVRSMFSNYAYVSLKKERNNALANTDPRHFFEIYYRNKCLIVDKINKSPALLKYIKQNSSIFELPGSLILLSSQKLIFGKGITSYTLLPFSINELSTADLLPLPLEYAIYKGGYPSVYTQDDFDVQDVYKNYLKKIAFYNFTKLCAGRIGKLLNLSDLAKNSGISVNTAKAWLSVLEKNFIVFLLHPHYQGFGKRMVITPKLYFYDTGLVCSLLGIESADQLQTHYMRSALFELFIISDLLKQHYNNGYTPHLYFWREKNGHEIDCLIENKDSLVRIEVRAGLTLPLETFDELRYWNALAKSKVDGSFLIYAGDENYKRAGVSIGGWQSLGNMF